MYECRNDIVCTTYSHYHSRESVFFSFPNALYLILWHRRPSNCGSWNFRIHTIIYRICTMYWYTIICMLCLHYVFSFLFSHTWHRWTDTIFVMFSYSHGLAAATAVTNVTSVDDYGCSVSSVRSARKTILWPQTIFIRLWDTISKLCLHHHQHQHPNGIQGNSTSAWTRTRAHKTSYKRLYKYTLYICSVTNVRFSIESFIDSISKMKGKKIEIKLNSFSMKSLNHSVETYEMLLF